MDTTAPMRLDLDATTAGTLTESTRVIGEAGLRDGASLFATPIARPTVDSDIKSIKLAFSGTLATTLDKLLCGSVTLNLDEDTPADLMPSIAGVRDLSLVFKKATGTGSAAVPASLVLSKNTGASLTGAEIKAILEELKFKSTSVDTGARLIDITLSDQAGNVSAASRARIELDRTPAPALTMNLSSATQLTYGVLTMNTFGTNNPKVLDWGDADTVSIPFKNEQGLEASTANDFLSHIKGISAAWGGNGISGGPNNLTETTRSYLGFTLPPVDKKTFRFAHQGGIYTKSVALNLTVDGDRLVLRHKGSNFIEKQDVYNSPTTIAENSSSLYSLGIIKVLYEKMTDLPNRAPTVEIQFDGSKATVGATRAARPFSDRPLPARSWVPTCA